MQSYWSSKTLQESRWAFPPGIRASNWPLPFFLKSSLASLRRRATWAHTVYAHVRRNHCREIKRENGTFLQCCEKPFVEETFYSCAQPLLVFTCLAGTESTELWEPVHDESHWTHYMILFKKYSSPSLYRRRCRWNQIIWDCTLTTENTELKMELHLFLIISGS